MACTAGPMEVSGVSDAWTESGNKELAQIFIGICTVGTLTALPDYLLKMLVFSDAL